MDPTTFIVVGIPSFTELSQSHDASYRGEPIDIELEVVRSGRGCSPGDYGEVLHLSEIKHLWYEERSRGKLVYFKGLTGQSGVVPRGRYVEGRSLDLFAQTGDLFISDRH